MPSRELPARPNLEQLLYVCHTSIPKADPARMDGLKAIARRLLALGANPNSEYHWNREPELPRTECRRSSP